MTRLASKHWREVSEGKRCRDCGHKRHMLLVIVHVNSWRRSNGEECREHKPVARCVDRAGCDSRVAEQKAAYWRQRDRQAKRSGVIFELEQPKAPDAKPPWCAWCGDKIVLVDPVAGYRYAQRRYHRGDEHETGERDCYGEFLGSRCWSSRVAVERVEKKKHGRVVCRECGVVCDEPDADGNIVLWEADHILALEDGGHHSLDNLQPLCVPHHREKTARENAARRRAA